LMRILVERARLPHEMAAYLLETMEPAFFERVREVEQAEPGMSDNISELLEGAMEVPTPKPESGRE
jgi:hypothetical protein